MPYHLIAFSAGFILDLIIGDPHWMPHPIRLIGRLISYLEHKFLEQGSCKKERRNGVLTVMVTLAAAVIVSGMILLGAYKIHPYLGVAVETILTCFCLATKSLRCESMKVYRALRVGDIEKSRYAVSMIVGRDTEALDEVGITKAAVETVAENTSDGVIAPLIYLAIGGPVLGMAYKAVNTMDSMIGYHNDRFENFGRYAARIDDVVNFVPARLSAWLIIASSALLGKEYSATGAYKIFRRDRFKHKSPNSAQTESAVAGSLGIRLAGDASYFGKIVRKPCIGDAVREISIEDIRRANRLLYASAVMAAVVCAGLLSICVGHGVRPLS